MQLLLIPGWELPALALTVLLLGGFVYFLMRSIKASKSGSKQQSHPGSPGVKQFKENIPFYKVASFKLAIGCLVAYIAAMIWLLSDYSEKVSNVIPKQQTDTTRQAAEDMGKPTSHTETIERGYYIPQEDEKFKNGMIEYKYDFVSGRMVMVACTIGENEHPVSTSHYYGVYHYEKN